jgi:chromosomal replication initiator protein
MILQRDLSKISGMSRRLVGACEDAVGQIVATVGADYHLDAADIFGPLRYAQIVEARHIAMHLARALTAYPLQAIGVAFARDHGTIIHGDNRTRHRIVYDTAFAARVARLRAAAEAQLQEAPARA